MFSNEIVHDIKNFVIMIGVLLLVAAVVSCNVQKEVDSNQQMEGTLFSQYFSDETTASIAKIKADFDIGMADDLEFDKVGDIYHFHNTTLRSDIFNQIPFNLTFPYNGEMALSAYDSELQSIEFFTKNCGFYDEKNDIKYNYWCLDTNNQFFEYLKVLAESSTFIDYFRKDYLERKAISPEIKKQLLLINKDDLDFNDPDHQIFYMLLHLCINEELQTSEKVNSKAQGG